MTSGDLQPAGSDGAGSVPSSSPTPISSISAALLLKQHPVWLCCSRLSCVNLPWPWHCDCSQPQGQLLGNPRECIMDTHSLESLAATSSAAKPTRTECSRGQGVGCEIQSYVTIINVFKSFQRLKILIFPFLF